ncbi:GAF domain-containing protein [Desulfosarcina sp.]|uniref:GAF domain-containing protein n=1 Tax=Desulfosarcina sp. TaxID=2027861 RepID=UPI003564377B
MTKETDFFKSFCKISAAFGTAATMQELLDLIVDSAISSLDGKAACLFLADERKDQFVPKAQAGLSSSYLHANPLKARQIVADLEKKGHLAFLDATSDPRLEHHEAKKREGIASLLTVPVTVKDHTIGVLSFYTAERREFRPPEIDFLCALADQGGIAIEKTRLLERIEKNTSLFLEFSSSINSSLDIKAVLRNMSEKMSHSLGMKGVTIRLLNEDSNALEVVASHGLSESFMNKGSISAEKSVTEALRGKTVVMEDTSTDKRLQYPKETEEEGIKSMVCVPIRSREKIIGVMRLYSDSVRKYSQDFITFVEALAHTGALAIQNASMYLALKEDKKNLEKDVWSHRLYF